MHPLPTSLIHDDLPSDGQRATCAAAARRCIKAFDEATAILAGDALQAFDRGLCGARPETAGQHRDPCGPRSSWSPAWPRRIGMRPAWWADRCHRPLAGPRRNVSDARRDHESCSGMKTGALVRFSAAEAGAYPRPGRPPAQRQALLEGSRPRLWGSRFRSSTICIDAEGDGQTELGKPTLRTGRGIWARRPSLAHWASSLAGDAGQGRSAGRTTRSAAYPASGGVRRGPGGPGAFREVARFGLGAPFLISSRSGNLKDAWGCLNGLKLL